MNSPVGREALARRGDARSFGQLIREWDHDLRGVVWSVVRRATDTDDVMQAAYEKAFRSIADFRGDASLKTWLHAICYRAALDHVRYESRRHHESDDVLAEVPASDSPATTAVNRAELATALDQLDPETRALLMLTAGLGYSFDEVAEMTELARGTVASKVGRARQTLRRFAEEQHQLDERTQEVADD